MSSRRRRRRPLRETAREREARDSRIIERALSLAREGDVDGSLSVAGRVDNPRRRREAIDEVVSIVSERLQ